MPSPYADLAPELWEAKTQELVDAHPLDPADIVDTVLTCWTAIFESRLGGKFRIGHDIQPKPQIMGFLLHELIPLELQSRHPFDRMPDGTDIERRNKALFAFLMITAARDGAISSFRLKHVDLIDCTVFQDAREVRTKAAKTFTTWFLPVDPVYLACFTAWVRHLRDQRLFGHDDPLFPPPEMGRIQGAFTVIGLKRTPYANAGAIREAIKAAFVTAGLPAFAQHSFRKTLVKWGVNHDKTPEALKAFSQNIGHESLLTTYSAYLPVSQERQAELIRGQTRKLRQREGSDPITNATCANRRKHQPGSECGQIGVKWKSSDGSAEAPQYEIIFPSQVQTLFSREATLWPVKKAASDQCDRRSDRPYADLEATRGD